MINTLVVGIRTKITQGQRRMKECKRRNLKGALQECRGTVYIRLGISG